MYLSKKEAKSTFWKEITVEIDRGNGTSYKTRDVICSLCGHTAYFDSEGGYPELFDFCPYCGRSMKRVK